MGPGLNTLPKLTTTTTRSLIRVINIIGPRLLSLPSTFLKLLFLNILSMSHQPQNIHLFDRHDCPTLFDNHFLDNKTNLLIRALEPATIVGAYFNNWVNFKVYSFTLIFSCFKLMNSCILDSLMWRGRIDVKSTLELVPIQRTNINILSSFHQLNYTWDFTFN